MCAGVALLGWAVPAPPSAPEPSVDPCALLEEDDVRAVQRQAVSEKVASDRRGRSFRVAQCVYRTPDAVRSVSLAVTLPLAFPASPSGARDYWRDRFHEAQGKDPPRVVEGLGEEAFWIGDRVTGALYVLQGEGFLRISVGGIGDESERLVRTKTLAGRAVKRLQAALRRP